MAIQEYEKNSERLFKVIVRVRSKQHRHLRSQKCQSGIKSRREAEKIERQLARVAHTNLSAKENRDICFGTLIDKWELALRQGTGSMRMLVKTTQEDYVYVLRSFASDWFKRPVDQISGADVRDVLEQIHTDGKSRDRQKRFKTAIDGIYKWGIETRQIKGVHFSPSKGVSLIGRIVEKPPEILTIAEIRLLMSKAREMRHSWYPVWAMALLTGCRCGELYSLKWTDVDFEQKRIQISRSYNKRTRTYGPTKAGYWRDVPINADLEKLLKELKLSGGSGEFVLPHHSMWSKYQQAAVLRQFCTEIGISSVKFHTLRACFATQLLKDSVAPSVVMKVCGWKDLKTMQRYVRMAGIEVEGATNSLKIMPDEMVYGRVVEMFDPK